MRHYQQALKDLHHYQQHRSNFDLRQAFAADPERFTRFSITLDDMLLDYSRSSIDAKAMAHLVLLAKAAGVEERRDAMFAGQHINVTEDRAVLHTALRAGPDAHVMADGINIIPEVEKTLQAMEAFAAGVRSGTLKGATGKPFTDVVNIGIGGSDLGPAMATLALAPYHDGPRLHYVSNIDSAHIADTLKILDPHTTLFIIASKTFTTVETMTNAETARRWIMDELGDEAVAAHFAAVSTALDKVAAFGIDAAKIFGFWDWVGGRYSLWSAIGLPIMIAVGPKNFRDFLAGAAAMDRHFHQAPIERNMPFILGLIGFWNRVVLNFPTRAVIPYDQRLARLPAYLQQLDMESNGKSVTIDGKPVETPTGPLVWGEPGTNGQHAFFQLLHQGTDIIPVEFILAATGHEPELKHHHDLLIANCLAQAEALMTGRSADEVRDRMLRDGMAADKAERLAPHRAFPGNRPSLTIIYERLTPYALGRLIALYEHRVFVEAALFRINAFDQWGVELGKELATGLLPLVETGTVSNPRDASTTGQISHITALRDLDADQKK